MTQELQNYRRSCQFLSERYIIRWTHVLESWTQTNHSTEKKCKPTTPH